MQQKTPALHAPIGSSHAHILQISHWLSALKSQSQCLATQFNAFKQQTLLHLSHSLSHFSTLLHKQITINAQLREELEVVKWSNCNMKKQVVQLREMIEDFVKSYNMEIQAKDDEIRQLRTKLGHGDRNENGVAGDDVGADGEIQRERDRDRGDGIQEMQKRLSLEVIQEVSEYTGSCLHSIREISIPNSAKGSIIPVNQNESNMTQTHQDSWVEQDNKTNKSKTFLNFFRKNIDQSVLIVQQKHKQKQNQSHCNSIDDLHLGDTDKINIPRAIQSPKNMQLLKKSTKKISLIQQLKQNISYVQLKTPHRRNQSTHSQPTNSQPKSEKISRSNSKPSSKQKIKVTSKLLQQPLLAQSSKRKPNRPSHPHLHLGGKQHLKKLTKQLRLALQEYKVWQGTSMKEVKYQGEHRNGMRWGKGKLLYDNGFEYEGTFVQNYRHGKGRVIVDGIVFYQGQWSLDQVAGQGYIRSMRNYAQYCPKFLYQASYCGQFMENKLHGMGTLFLNQNEKIVTKFVHGMPVGDFTYYNHAEIEFGSWY